MLSLPLSIWHRTKIYRQFVLLPFLVLITKVVFMAYLSEKSEMSFFFIMALTILVIMVIPQEQRIYTFPKPSYIITFGFVLQDIQTKTVSIDMFRFQKFDIYFEFKRVEVIRFFRVFPRTIFRKHLIRFFCNFLKV